MDKKERTNLQLVHSAELTADADTEKFVRITERMANGYVAFDFAMGSPDLFVELVLPEAAFEAFCETNNVKHMTQEQSDLVDEEMRKFRYGDEGMERKASAAQSRADREAATTPESPGNPPEHK